MKNFSIIVPYHVSATQERAGMLRELLASIPARGDIEVVLVDDHSAVPFTAPACPFDVIQAANPPGTRYAGLARNTGLERAQGRYILFADSDDLYDTDALNRLLDDVLADLRDTVTVFYPTSFIEGTRDLGSRHLYMQRNLDAFVERGDVRFYARIVSPVCKIIPRSIIDRHAMAFTGHSHGNDVVFAALLFAACPRPVVCRDEIYKIRCHDDSLMGQHTERSLLSRLDAIRQANGVLHAAGLGPCRHLYDGWLLRLMRMGSPAWRKELLLCMRQDPGMFAGLDSWKRRADSRGWLSWERWKPSFSRP